MSGIAGIYNLKKKNKLNIREELSSMINAIKYRGPDSQNILESHNIALGHRQLKTNFSSNNKQFAKNEDGNVFVVCDGEILNYISLKCQLEKKEHKFNSQNIAEVIVYFYEKEGIDFIERIEGMFAFALWDANKNKLILARDKMGIKPIFYSINRDRFLFASEIKGILAHKFFIKKIDFESFYFYLFSNGYPSHKTMFKNIFRVLPGELVIINGKGNLHRKKYWHPAYESNIIKDNLNIESASNYLLKMAKDSLALYARSDFTSLGVALSGGLDSTALVALMSNLSSRKKSLKTFSLRFKGETVKPDSELANARKVSKALQTDHYEFSMSANDLMGHIDEVVHGLDLPFCCWGMNFFLSRYAKKHISIILEGNGIEEYFGGYWNHRLALKLLNDQSNKGELSKNRERELWFDYFSALQSRSWDIPFSYGFLESSKKKLCRFSALRQFNKHSLENFMREKYNELRAKDFVSKVLEWDAAVLLHTNAMAINDLSMVNSVETHYPFLNYKIVELALSLPSYMKFKDGWDKYIWRKAVEPVVGKIAFSTVEKGFMPPIELWLSDKTVKKWIQGILSFKRTKRHNLFSMEFVNRLIKEHYAKSKKENIFAHSRSTKTPDERNHAIKIWKLIMFQLWWERYFI